MKATESVGSNSTACSILTKTRKLHLSFLRVLIVWLLLLIALHSCTASGLKSVCMRRSQKKRYYRWNVIITARQFFGHLLCRKKRQNFFALLLIVFALEVTAGVMGYVYKDKAKEFVNDGFIDAIKNYDNKDSSLDKAVDDLQSKLKCCGSNGPTDWKLYGQHQDPPRSCYPDGSPKTYTEGCLDKITDDVKKNLSYVLGTAIGVAVLQLLGMIVACYLMCCSRESGYLRLEGGIRV